MQKNWMAGELEPDGSSLSFFTRRNLSAKMKKDVVTFGETMVRLSAPEKKRLEQAEQLDVHVGGSESNVAVAIKRLGLDTVFVTRLTANPFGRMIVNKLREHGVDSFTAGFLYGYLTGDVQKAVKFGNATSAIKQTNLGDINWCTHDEVRSLAEGGGRVRISR